MYLYLKKVEKLNILKFVYKQNILEVKQKNMMAKQIQLSIKCAFGYCLFYWKLKTIKKSFFGYCSLLKLLFMIGTCKKKKKKKLLKRGRPKRERTNQIYTKCHVWIQRFPLNPALRFSTFFFPSLNAFCFKPWDNYHCSSTVNVL